MNKIINYCTVVWVTLFTLCLGACSDEQVASQTSEEGVLLNMYIGSTVQSRLAELPSTDAMFTAANGKKNVGIYIYYQDDYDKGDLSKPYVRNLECTKSTDGKLVPKEANQNIYIYDRMTIVAFYPYNEKMSDKENYFTIKNDEKAYPITESDYSKQTYIPYRAETNVNPTNAYMAELHFTPRQTCKIEVLLVSGDESKFPTSTNYKDGNQIKMVPSIDPYKTTDWDGTQANPDQREQWLDDIKVFTQTGGGQHVRRYVTYVWKSAEKGEYGKTEEGKAPHHDDYAHNDNNLKAGDILFESDKLTLLMPRDLNYAEETVYRYGYNLDTGEIFIPTSDIIAYDAASLQNLSFGENTGYQVCDIDLSGVTWKPMTTYNGTFDGGGHAIKNLTITAAPGGNVSDKEVDKQSFGLFSSLTGTSTLKNVNLEEPKITVTFTYSADKKDTCYVGALCGIVNPGLSEAAKRKLILDGLPSELSETVKEALVQDRLKDFTGTTCYVKGCRVLDPQITVTGSQVRVGGLIGGAGNQEQKADVKESYVRANSSSAFIKVNAAGTTYTDVFTGAFCGLVENGKVCDSYAAIDNVEGYVQTQTTTGGSTVTGSENQAYGFSTMKKDAKDTSISGCYTTLEDKTGSGTPGVTNFTTGWPAWNLYAAGSVSNGYNNDGLGTNWPAYSWDNSWNDNGSRPSVYPSLIWEHQLIVEYK